MSSIGTSVNLEALRKWAQILLIPLALWAVSIEIFRAETRVEHGTMEKHADDQAKGLKSLRDIVMENAKQTATNTAHVGILLERENRRTN